MFSVKNLTDNSNVKVVDALGAFTVIEYDKDMSVAPFRAQEAYFSSMMNIHKRQIICDLSKSPVTIQEGSMQMMIGNAQATTGIKGAGDLIGKALRGKMTKESAIKPEYVGNGIVILEPTYKYIILIDVDDWNQSVVLDNGSFLACESDLKQKLVTRTNLSSTVAGDTSFFNLGLMGGGVVALESPCPPQELIEISLKDDQVKIDGNMAVAWSGSLDFTVERSGKTLVGSAVSGEGLVNVYRGTGKILVAPVKFQPGKHISMPGPADQQ
ncbi:MAG: AIM24 family protein [Faecalicoccus sp.]|nr:AIM24 family protein [Faecalicoccus sp.]